jgi:hypothetical protein
MTSKVQITPLNLHKTLEFNGVPKVRYEIFSDKIVIWPQPDSKQTLSWEDWTDQIFFNDKNWLRDVQAIFGELKISPVNPSEILEWWNSHYKEVNPIGDKVLILEEAIDSYELKHRANKVYVLAQLPKYLPADIIQDKIIKLINVYQDIDL